MPLGLLTELDVRLVGETIGPVLGVDGQGLRSGNLWVRVSLHLNERVRLSCRVRVSPVDVIELHFRYERMFERCRVCSMISHGGQRCPIMAEAEAALMPPPPSRPKMVFRAASSTLGVFSVPALNLKVHDKKVVIIRELLKGGAASARVSGLELAGSSGSKKRGRPRRSKNKSKPCEDPQLSEAVVVVVDADPKEVEDGEIILAAEN
ncbi:hypothetical protein ACLB2K_011295 [Fragaria x ananassa]